MSDDLMRALVQGPDSRPGAGEKGSDALAQLLQGLLGGASMQEGMSQAAGGTSQEQEYGAQSAAPGLGGLLEAIMGGGLGGAESQPAPGGGGGLADILGAIVGGGLGGAESQSASGGGGGLADILGAIMGGGAMGGASGAQTNPIVDSIAAGLADKLGLPPQIARIVVVFVMNKLLKRRAEAGASSQPPAPGQAQPMMPQTGEMDLDSLLDKINKGQTLRMTDLSSTDMADELVQQTGLSSRDASASLAYVFNELGSQYGASAQPAAPSAPEPEGLANLLDTWR
jgi:hypothetical protein